MKKIRIQFEASPEGNILICVGGLRPIIYACVPVPDGASDDYGYKTMKQAIVDTMTQHGYSASIIDSMIEWWYSDGDLLEADAAEGTAAVEIDWEALAEVLDGKQQHYR